MTSVPNVSSVSALQPCGSEVCFGPSMFTVHQINRTSSAEAADLQYVKQLFFVVNRRLLVYCTCNVSTGTYHTVRR